MMIPPSTQSYGRNFSLIKKRLSEKVNSARKLKFHTED